MKNNVFIPKKIKVGFQSRSDTYSKKLAYIIYYDEKNKLRKETSWGNWRDKKIDPEEFENVPISGFVLNKKVGGNNYSWNPRQTYTRVYDPRGFEFEITIPNLLYILENSNCIKGKGLEGDFVYAWSGAELLLLPVDAPDYKSHVKFSNGLLDPEKKIGTADLKVGFVYKLFSGKKLIYLGKLNEYFHSFYEESPLENTFVQKSHYFYRYDYKARLSLDNLKNNKKTKKKIRNYGIETYSSIPKIAECVSDEIDESFSKIWDCLEQDPRYNPNVIYEIKTEPYSFDEFEKFIIYSLNNYNSKTKENYILTKKSSNKISCMSIRQSYNSYGTVNLYRIYGKKKSMSIKEIFDEFKPLKIVEKIKIKDKKNE